MCCQRRTVESRGSRQVPGCCAAAAGCRTVGGWVGYTVPGQQTVSISYCCLTCLIVIIFIPKCLLVVLSTNSSTRQKLPQYKVQAAQGPGPLDHCSVTFSATFSFSVSFSSSFTSSLIYKYDCVCLSPSPSVPSVPSVLVSVSLYLK